MSSYWHVDTAKDFQEDIRLHADELQRWFHKHPCNVQALATPEDDKRFACQEVEFDPANYQKTTRRVRELSRGVRGYRYIGSFRDGKVTFERFEFGEPDELWDCTELYALDGEIVLVVTPKMRRAMDEGVSYDSESGTWS